MKSLVAALLMICALEIASAAQCLNKCTRNEQYYTSCGTWGWRVCTRYRKGYYNCYQTCEHGGWSEYTVKSEGACSLPCGGGKKSVTYQRTCTNPAPFNGGNPCSGDSEMTQDEPCNTQECPIDGGWTSFAVESVGECSKTCGSGSQTLTFKRTCTNPTPQYGGRQCMGDDTMKQLQACNTQPCPIDGGWSDFTAWEDYDECSALCGEGAKDQWRSRTCDNPAPQYGGKDCDGPDKVNQTVACNTEPCGVDGGWSDFTAWEDYDECSALCGEGAKDQWRSRTCVNPAPQYGGKDCDGPDKVNQTVACNTEPCRDQCPEESNTYIANAVSPGRYYICDNGVAKLQECQENTVWDQETLACVHAQDQKAMAWKSGDECDPDTLYNFHPDCAKYIMCIAGHAYEMACPAGTRFNFAISACDHEENVLCATTSA